MRLRTGRAAVVLVVSASLTLVGCAEVVEISKDVGVEECGQGSIDAEAQATFQLGEGNVLAGAWGWAWWTSSARPSSFGMAQEGDAAFDHPGGDMIEADPGPMEDAVAGCA